MTRDSGPLFRLLSAPARYLGIYLLFVALALTFIQREFLASRHWTPVGRNPVQWPSVMLLGPAGWILGASLVIAAAVLMLAGFYLVTWQSTAVRIAGASLALVGAAVALQAIPPADGTQSGLKWLHDAAYPLIPVGWLIAAILLTVTWWSVPEGRLLARGTLVLIPLFVVAVLGVMHDSVAQASRYGIFLIELIWFQLVARTLDTMQPEGDSGGRQ